MKKVTALLLALAGGFAVVLGTPTAGLAYTSTGTPYPLIVVNNGPGIQSDPHVSGHHVAYTATGAGGVVNYFDLSTSSTATVPTVAGTSDSLPDISDSTIVFTRATADGALRIFSYPIGGTPIEVAPVAFPIRVNPAIGGSTIAWSESSVNLNHDLFVESNGTVTQLTNDSATNDNINPNVSPDGSTVVWEKCAPPGICDIYAAINTGSGWSVSPIAATAANERGPDTNGNIVVYASKDAGCSGGAFCHIHIRSLSAGTDQTIPLPAEWIAAIFPAIAGDFVAFVAFDGTQTDILVYDVADGSLRQITSTAESEILPDISTTTSGSITTVTVTWQVTEADSTHVYATLFTVASRPPFTDQFLPPLTQSTDAASPVLNTGKNGRVIPVKVQIDQGGTPITDANTPGPVTIAVSKLASCSTSVGSDPIATYADAGQSSAGTNEFRYDASVQVWIYNLDTRVLGLVSGNCYRIDVSVSGTQIVNTFAVFEPTK